MAKKKQATANRTNKNENVGFFVDAPDVKKLDLNPQADGTVQVTFGAKAKRVDIEEIRKHAGKTVRQFVNEILKINEANMILFVDDRMVGPGEKLTADMSPMSITGTKKTGTKG